jgi:hypothetical protein
MSETSPAPLPVLPEQLRLLEWHERVERGDFVADDRQGFALWEGPAGFRADAFVKQIYRRLGHAPAKTKRSS